MPRNRKSQVIELEVEQPEIVADDKIFNKEDIQLFPMGRHVWRQQGCYVVCRECELHHAVFIGMDQLMVGEDQDGKPILKSRQDVFGTN